jgi:hypothetical protein
MNDPSLELLLKRADAQFRKPPHEMTAAALLTAVRRRRTRSAGVRSVAAVGAILAISVSLLAGRPGPEPTGSAPPASDWSLKRPVRPADGASTLAESPHDLDALRAELARLDREADARMQVVAAVTQQDDDSEDADHGGALAGLELIRLETARSAALSLQYAIQVEEEFQDVVAARREYQRVAKRFPGTEWAHVALASESRLAATSLDPSTL